jgi:hypothetical protein
LLALVEVVLQGSLPVAQPGADPAFEAACGGLSILGASHRRNLLDLRGEPLGFRTLLLAPSLEFLTRGVGVTLDRLLQGLDARLGGAHAFFKWRGCHRQGTGSGRFQARNSLLEPVKLTADDDFPDAFDRLGRIEG